MSSDPFKFERQRHALREILERLKARLPSNVVAHGALLDLKGDLIDAIGTNAIHFASFEPLLQAAKKYITVKQGETLITNDCYSGSPRLCDLLLVQGAFGKNQANELRYYVAVQLSFTELLNRKTDGLARSVEDEGYRIPPTPLEQNGALNQEIVSYLCLTLISREILTEALNASRVALKNAAQELIQLEHTEGRVPFVEGLVELRAYSEKVMKKALHEIPDGDYSAFESLDFEAQGGTPLQIHCKLSVQGENILLSFAGTSKQTIGPFNCNYTTTLGACFWVLRSLVKIDIPINAGAFKAFSVEAPEGSLVNARYPAPLLGGYFETSRRIIDTLYTLLSKALPSETPAHNGGSSSLSFVRGEKFFSALTLGCGGGATSQKEGASGVFSELDNRPSSSIEAFEDRFPIEITHARLRETSQGKGKHDGGKGISYGYRFLVPTEVLVMSDRRELRARGLNGATGGAPTEVQILRDAEKKKEVLTKGLYKLNAGDSLVINSPGGGGWGKAEIAKDGDGEDDEVEENFDVSQ